MERPVKSKTRLSSVANACRVLRAFSAEEYELGISELAKRLTLAKSTVHRLALTLIHAGLLEQNPDNGKYRLGLTVFELGSLVRRQMDIANQAKPFLKMLMEKTGETVHLAILDQHSVVYINKIESRQAVRMSSNVGSRNPLYCTGIGKALLAFQPAEKIEEIIAAGLTARTPKTLVDPDALRRELAAIRARGYAIDDEEIEIGLRCLGVPIRDYTGAVIASLSVAGPAQRMTMKALHLFAPDVIQTGRAISQRLGHVNPQSAMNA